jgi:hypothetical protein
MAYQQEPDSIIWFVRDDGALIGLTYMREQQVLAWHRHDTDGLFESVCSIPGTDYNEVYFVVKRGEKRFIEKLTKRAETENIMDYFMVDCGLTYEGDPVNVITGLNHLEGRTVTAIADGNVISGLTVTDGTITLPVMVQKVHIGLPYVSEISPLKIELQDQQGTIQSKKTSIPKFTISFLRSRGGYVGYDYEHLQEIVQRSNEPLGEPVALKTYDHKVEMSSGYKENNQFIFRQTDPLPFTILAIISEVIIDG